VEENVNFLDTWQCEETVGLHALAGVVSGSKLPHRFLFAFYFLPIHVINLFQVFFFQNPPTAQIPQLKPLSSISSINP
jgi:hypothetical protein